ncbi:hypothetical protein H257_03508 [Aphanomyces astaci]|uniref:Guanine nucleotide-binding protein subunit beta-like protein n=1 Tax=Aphanomyces astaci TaxID=112090 RepID=W4GZ08_APHAT|nr:hypothetical protein H257_03508 [Aphanomyces astaci]ETV84249.1 hypothetical protein H257_03508 [Aphanomyces astaci]|eukprot:XP_009825941.1 hypothetical protein H257_03508 [Aphanomyces astaci]
MARNNRAPPPVAVLRGHLSPVNTVCFIPSRPITPNDDVASLSSVAPRSLLSGSADGMLKVWDLTTRREASSAVQAHSKAGILHTTTQGPNIVSQGRDGLVKWWDVVDGGGMRESRTLAIGSYTFTKAHVVDSNLLLVPTEHAETVALFDVRTSGTHPAMIFEGSPIKSGMCMSLTSMPVSDQTVACVGFEGGVVALYDFRLAAPPLLSHAVSTSTVLCMDAVCTSSTLLCGTSGDDLVALRVHPDTTAATADSFYRSKQPGISAIANRSVDDRIFATAGWDHRVRIFHKRGKPLATLKYHTESVYSVGFSHDGDWLASASKDHKIALWSVYPPSFSSTSSTSST